MTDASLEASLRRRAMRFSRAAFSSSAASAASAAAAVPEAAREAAPVLALAGLQRLCVALRLGFSPADVAAIAAIASDSGGDGGGGGGGEGEGDMSVGQFAKLFGVPEGDEAAASAALGDGPGSKAAKAEAKAAADAAALKPRTWDCGQCGCVNPAHEMMCERCGFGWAGQREVPPDKWACDACSFFNSKTNFYCDICNRARPDLGTVRF